MKLPRLREWRESRGLTQRELASRAGVGEKTVPRAEAGESIRPNTAQKFADVMRIEVVDLMESPPVPLGEAPQESGPLEPPLDYDTIVSEVLRVVKPDTSEALNTAVLEQGVRELSSHYSVEDLHRFERELPKERSRIYQRGARSPRTVIGLPKGDFLRDLLNIDLNIECVRRALEAEEYQTTRTAAE